MRRNYRITVLKFDTSNLIYIILQNYYKIVKLVNTMESEF